MNAVQLITELARKGGLTPEAESLTQITQNEALAAIELPGDLATALNGLMGIEQAKTNQKVKSYFFAQALNGIDNQILTDAREAGIPEEKISLLEAEKATGKRQQMLTQFLKDAKPAPSAEATQKLREAQERINALQAEKEQAVQEVHQKWNAEREGMARKTYASEIPWPEHYHPATRVAVLQASMAEQLAKDGAVEVYNPQTGGFDLRNANDPTLPFTGANGLEVSHKDYVARVAAEYKFIKTDASAAANAGNSQNTEQRTYQGKVANTKEKSNPALDENKRILAAQGIEV